MRARIFLAMMFLAVASPAFGQDPTQVPEGSQATLFALGLVGVIVGRRASMRRNRDKD
jgi:hypothetical protein